MSFHTNTQITRPPQGVNQQYSSWSNNQQNPTYTKPQYQATGVHKQRSPGGGWEEDAGRTHNPTEVLGSRDNNVQMQGNQGNIWKDPVSSKSENAGPSGTKTSNKPSNDAGEYEVVTNDENFLGTYEYENKIVSELIQPGGARVKQTDATLSAFCKTCESIPPKVVGSLLLSKFNENIPWISKARIIFGIEALSTKLNNYFDYFKHNLEVLKKVNFHHEGMNAIQLRNLMNSLTQILEQPHFDGGKQKENQIFKTNSPQTQDKSKPTTMNPSKPAIGKAISSPVTSTTTPFILNTTEPLQDQPNSNIPKNQAAQPSKLSTQQPVDQNSNVQAPIQQSNQPQASSQKPSEAVTSANGQSAQESHAKLPLDQMGSLIDSLSDLDFSNTSASTKDDTVGPNNVQNFYGVSSPMNFPGMNPMNYMGGYMGNMHSPMYQNYPANNYPVQNGGGFNAYYNQHMTGGTHGGQPHYNRQNSRHATYPGGNPHTDSHLQMYDKLDEMLKEVPEIDYDKEEKEKEKKRKENEKRFDVLDFKF